jgi:excisionase family DNA binding protein
MMSNEYLTASDVSERYGVTDQTIRRLVADGQFPAAIAIGRQLRWRKIDLDAWDAKQAANAGVPK